MSDRTVLGACLAVVTCCIGFAGGYHAGYHSGQQRGQVEGACTVTAALVAKGLPFPPDWQARTGCAGHVLESHK
jgi:hypothetical protein